MNLLRDKIKVLRITAAVILLGVAMFFAGRYVLYLKIRNAIVNELASLKSQGIYVDYENLEVHPWDGKLEMHELHVNVRKDSVNKDSVAAGLNAYLPYITLEGVNVIPFLRNKTIAVDRIHSYETYVTYRSEATLFDKKSNKKRQIEVQNISVNNIEFPRIDFYLTGGASNDTVAHLLSDVDMNGIFLAKQFDSLTWQRGDIEVTNFAMNYQKENYGFSMRRLHLDISDKTIEVDSFLVKPTISKDRFMKLADRQCTYVEAAVPKLTMRSVDWYTFPTATLQMDMVSLQVTTTMYRDKRLPFRQTEDRALPSHMLHRLPFRLRIDTAKIYDSRIRYEEMPESGDSVGMVFFDRLNVALLTVHNNPNLKVDTRMHAKAKFMGDGDLDAWFTFPYDTLQPYRAAGTLANFSLPKVNTMLGAAAKAKIQSGTMQKFTFNFTYNNDHSHGEVMMNYDNLKVLSLRENSKEEQSVNRVKTWLLNALVIRKNMDEDLRDDKRKGTIDFERDKKRSVFNYWWKSILSGVKSAYNLDKLPLNAVAEGDKKDKKRKKDKKKTGTFKEIFSKIFK